VIATPHLIIRPANLVDHEGRVVLRGDMDLISSIDHLRVDWYQREQGFSRIKLKKLCQAMRAGCEFPDVTLGMRGNRWEIGENDAVSLLDEVYIIDGLQRWAAAMIVLKEDDTARIRLGAKVYFNTDSEFERQQFKALNTNHTTMSPAVHLRNEREVSRVAGTLYGLSENEPKFALYGRVSWGQTADREIGGHLIKGNTLLKVMAVIHSHKIGKLLYSGHVHTLLADVDQRIDRVGLQRARENLITFFDFIDSLWPIRGERTQYGMPQMIQGWLNTIGKILSDHTDFWRDNDCELFVPAALSRSFERLDPSDDNIRKLAGSNNAALSILETTIIKQLNSGKRTLLTNRHERMFREGQSAKYFDEASP